MKSALIVACLLLLSVAQLRAIDVYDSKGLVMRIPQTQYREIANSEIEVRGKKFPAISLKDLLVFCHLQGDEVILQGDNRQVVLSWQEATAPDIYIYFTKTNAERFHSLAGNDSRFPARLKAITVHRKTKWQTAMQAALFSILLFGACFSFLRTKNSTLRAAIVFLVVLFVYWQFEVPNDENFSDNLWYVPTSLSLLHQGNLELSEYNDLIHNSKEYGIYRINGAPYNLFPVGTSLLILPLVWLGSAIYQNAAANTQPFLIAAFTAKVIAALSVGLLYLLIVRLTRDGMLALILSGVFAFATSQLSIHAGGLWSHNVVIPLLLISLLLLSSGNDRILWLTALPLALAYITRPTFSIHIVIISIYIFLFHRKAFLRFAVLGLSIAAIFVAFSHHTYHSFLPPYYSAERMYWENFLEAFAANMISPNRGLLIFTPIFLGSFYGIYVSFKRKDRFYELLSVLVFAHWFVICLSRNWWAGATIGPRFFSDIVPVLMLLLIPAYDEVKQMSVSRKRIAVSVFVFAVVWSLSVQVRSASSIEPRRWNSTPVSIASNPERVWDWSDMQILRTASKRLELTETQPKKPLPDFLLITIDTLRADHLGCYGYEKGTSPTIDEVAKTGLRFENAYSAVPLTLPSHTTILTGLYPNHHGIRDNAYFPPSNAPYIQELLKKAGYQTAAFVSGAPLLSTFGINRSFDFYDDEFEGSERKADQTTSRALRWLKAARRPFFLWVHYFDPHAEYDPPAEYKAKFVENPYDGEIAFVDHELLQLLSAVGNQTVVIITADHGESLGEHGEKTHGVFLYNATLSVPLIVRGPRIRSGVVKEPVSLCDIAPSIVSLAGLEQNNLNFDGVSLFHKRNERTLLAESLYAKRNFGYAPLYASIRADKKYVMAPDPEFYDLHNDPRELQNLITREKPANLRNAINDYLKNSVTENSAALDSEQAEKLRSLGYVGGSMKANQIDPKQKIAVIEKFNDGLRFLKTSEYEQSEKTFREILKSEPRNLYAMRFLGDSLSAQKKYEDAAQAFSTAYSASKDPDVAVQLAKTSNRLKKSAQAEAILQETVQRYPSYADARYELASLYASEQRWSEASAILNGNQAEDSNQRGILYLAQKQPQKAISEFQTAVNAEAKSKYWNNLAIAYQQSGQFAEAEKAYQEALQINPDFEQSEANLAFLLMQQQRWSQAENHLLRITAKNRNLWRARIALGFVYEKEGRRADAIKVYQDLLSDAPPDLPELLQVREHLRQLEK